MNDDLAFTHPLTAAPPEGCGEAHAAAIRAQRTLFRCARHATRAYRAQGRVSRDHEERTDAASVALWQAVAAYHQQVRALGPPPARRGRFGGRRP